MSSEFDDIVLFETTSAVFSRHLARGAKFMLPGLARGAAASLLKALSTNKFAVGDIVGLSVRGVCVAGACRQ